MSLPERVIRPTAAEHVREGDWVLAAWEGTLGIWRVTMTQPGHDRANVAAVHLTVSLHLVRINSSGERMVQLHRWDALVPVLVPIPEPPVVELETQTLEPQRVIVEVQVQPRLDDLPQVAPCGATYDHGPHLWPMYGCNYCPGLRCVQIARPCRAEPVDRGDGLMLWPCRYCGSTDWKRRCPSR